MYGSHHEDLIAAEVAGRQPVITELLVCQWDIDTVKHSIHVTRTKIDCELQGV